MQTSRRKELYEILHPETAHGAVGRGGKSRQFGDSSEDRFTVDTAERTGRSERAVQRDAARGKALGEDLNRIAGTSLDKGRRVDLLDNIQEVQQAPTGTSREAGLRRLQKAAAEGNADAVAQLALTQERGMHFRARAV